jgi:hypothetical protein
MIITIYIRSVAYVTDKRGQIGVSHHYTLQGIENAFVTTRRSDDRLYETESARILEIAADLPEEQGRLVRVTDVSTFSGWWLARWNRIHSTPSVVVDRTCYEGLERAGQALQEVCG